MKKNIVLFFVLLLSNKFCSAQIGIGTNSPNSSSLVEIKSTAKGLLIPRMTQAQRIAIGSPAEGLLLYQTDQDTGFYYLKGGIWKNLSSVTGAGTTQKNKILYVKDIIGSGSEIWIADYAGTNNTKINIALPTGLELGGSAKFSPDGQTLFFVVYSTTTNGSYIYASKADGTNVHLVIDGTAANIKDLSLEQVY